MRPWRPGCRCAGRQQPGAAGVSGAPWGALTAQATAPRVLQEAGEQLTDEDREALRAASVSRPPLAARLRLARCCSRLPLLAVDATWPAGRIAACC